MDFIANVKKLIAETHENDFEVKYYPVSNNCKVPTKSTAVPAGYELYAAENKEILPGSNANVSLDLRLVILFGFYGQIFLRSGLFLNHHITAEAAVIDSEYRAIVKVLLNNQSDKKLSVKVGQRIAQMVFLETFNAKFTCVQLLPETERQDSGFGSSGYF